MPRKREWIRAVLFGLTWALAMEGVGSLLTGRPVNAARILGSAPVWVWFYWFLARRGAAGRCSRRAPEGP